jgi:hypothetical protein
MSYELWLCGSAGYWPAFKLITSSSKELGSWAAGPWTHAHALASGLPAAKFALDLVVCPVPCMTEGHSRAEQLPHPPPHARPRVWRVAISPPDRHIRATRPDLI